ncbi:cyclic AMP response element-binding protein A [Culicoides brevitarsis]|uniref:cyclic AMP response element-binding protein A n=1 Tax=Culicoides brevitarsis TaxID=469753 RepID=UPI00307CB5B1
MDYYDISADLWDSDLDPTMQDHLKLSSDPDMPDWFSDRDSKIPQVILNDKLMTDAIIGPLPIKTEHSYSLNSDGDSMPDSPNSLHNKMDDMDECYPAIPMQSAHKNSIHHSNQHVNHANANNNNCSSNNNNNNYINLIQSLQNNPSLNNNNNNLSNNNLLNANGLSSLHSYNKYSHSKKGSDASSTTSGSDFEMDSDEATIKEEPLSPGSSCPPSPTQCGAGYTVSSVNLANIAAYNNTDLVYDHKNGTVQMSNGSQSLLKNSNVMLGNGSHRMVIPKVKMESNGAGFGLPPTPPSSVPSDESEGNQSPEHAPLSPQAPATSSRRTSVNNSSSRGYTNGSSSRQPIHTPLISTQPKGSTGTLMLTEEEKRTLLAEGYPIPTRLPLTKAEEKSLKKIRRKIKNKISAQESRRKKKEYMDQLERKVELLEHANSDYKKRCDELEGSNNSLMMQLKRLQKLVEQQNRK